MILKFNIIIFSILIMFASVAYAGLAAELLYDTAIEYYRQGNRKEALKAFEKILIIEPENHLALEYINLIKGETTYMVRESEYSGATHRPKPKNIKIENKNSKRKDRTESIAEVLKELERDSIMEKALDAKEGAAE